MGERPEGASRAGHNAMSDLFEYETPHFDNNDLIDRCRALNDNAANKSAKYVLCWLQQSLRAYDNPVIDAAISYANANNLPVVVYHGMRQDYPHASDRLHYFLLGGSRDLQIGCDARRLRCVSYLQTPDNIEKGLVYRLAQHARAVFAEDHPTFVARWQTQSFASKTDAPVYAIDAARLVPTQMLPRGLKTTPAFRAANKALREKYADAVFDLVPKADLYEGELGFEDVDLRQFSDGDLEELLIQCDIDHSVWTCAEFPPKREEALLRLNRFITDYLPRYKWTRNNPAASGSGSELSPYLHFGLLGPRELYKAVRASEAHSAAKWKFLDEAVTWREWFHYQAYYTDRFDTFEALPNSAKKTLLAHQDDPRDTIYDLDTLLHGETDDLVWNAAQKQWLITGYMHNNLRMYWGKKLIGWTPDPKTAWNVACYINDRLSLDGRDPATYGNMQWCFGKAKPGYRELPVYGWVAPKSSRALIKRDGVNDWLDTMNDRYVDKITVPTEAEHPSYLNYPKT